MVVDDSIVPRTAARAMIGSVEEFQFAGEAVSGAAALEVVDKLRPDIVLMDVDMPRMDGPTTTRTLLATHPGMKIVAWTVSDSPDDLLRMMQAGCTGYVLKDVGPSELRHALLAALRSESPVPRRMIPEMLRRIAPSAPAPSAAKVSLTSREMQILRGAAKGYTNKRLAHELGLQATSVETHFRNIFKKLSARNRGEAVSAALKLGLITLADV